MTSWTAGCQAFLFITISQSLLKLMSIELVMSYTYLILCHPLLLLPSIFPSIRVFSNELALCIRWPKYWSFSISPSSEYLKLISFRTDGFDLLAVQGTLKNLLQHCNSKTSILLSSCCLCLKNRDITLMTKVHLLKAMVLSVVMYGCERWTIKKAEHWRTDVLELWCCWLLRVPWTTKRSNQSILKEISPEY